MKFIAPILLFLIVFPGCCQRDTQADRDSASILEERVADNESTPPTGIQSKETKMKEQRSGTWFPGLSENEKSVLFAIATDTLEWCVRGSQRPFPIESYEITPKLRVHTATFVTLHLRGNLRGCIGSLAPEEPLFLSVHNNTVNAALRDPRFMPVQPSELPDIEIALSLLSPIRPISTVEEFKLGEHGIILQKGMRRAVFLPEVAPEQGWTKEETLSHLSIKAGLPPDAWKSGARFEVFESVVLTRDK